MSDAVDREIERRNAEAARDRERARAKGFSICGFARACPKCGGNGYHAPSPDWMNRVVCLDCGKKWSE